LLGVQGRPKKVGVILRKGLLGVTGHPEKGVGYV
jgi:hypothetical protein